MAGEMLAALEGLKWRRWPNPWQLYRIRFFNSGRLETPRMEENDNVNVIYYISINNSIHSNIRNFVKFNPEVKNSIRPKGKWGTDMKDREKVILMNLNNMNQIERDDRKTSSKKFKLLKDDIYGLALVDTVNLVKGTLVSSEFWNTIGEKA